MCRKEESYVPRALQSAEGIWEYQDNDVSSLERSP
jgi:hypothetical protein